MWGRNHEILPPSGAVPSYYLRYNSASRATIGSWNYNWHRNGPNRFSARGAEVKVRNEGTGVETALITNDAGAYTTPPLVLGTLFGQRRSRLDLRTSVNSGD